MICLTPPLSPVCNLRYANRVVDSSGFDYASFRLRRPVPCPAGTYCHSGSASEDLGMHNFTMPQPCLEVSNSSVPRLVDPRTTPHRNASTPPTHLPFPSIPQQGTALTLLFPCPDAFHNVIMSHQSMFCPEGSSRPSGVGECPSGFYCPTGIRLSCPVGTYCPREGHWDPMPCPPGQFSALVGQKACTSCPRGYICPGFGRIDPTPCPDGMVCSRIMLTSPNQRCPPGEDHLLTSHRKHERL